MHASDEFQRMWNSGYLGVMASLMRQESSGAAGMDPPGKGIEQVVRRYFTGAPLPDLSEDNSLVRYGPAEGTPGEGWFEQDGPRIAG